MKSNRFAFGLNRHMKSEMLINSFELQLSVASILDKNLGAVLWAYIFKVGILVFHFTDFYISRESNLSRKQSIF